MQLVDFNKLLDASGIQNTVTGDSMPPPPASLEDIYQGSEGVRVRSQCQGRKSSLELVRLSERAFLIASASSAAQGELQHRQAFNDSDWVHIQFRLSGGGREQVSRAEVIETPEKTCVVLRYPQNSIIERTSDVTDSWKAACLLVSPKALTGLLDIPASRLPESAAWVALQDPLELRASVLPLHSTFVLTINDIFSCSLRGDLRRAFMRAKALELLAMVIHALNDSPAGAARPTLKLSSTDLDRLSLSRSIMTGNLASALTLDQLARRVGLNRTKLALGFKEVYGTSVQAYWRDAKLSRARELLSQEGARVTEVALSLGYSELSSFTRAFSRKFGESPRACRGASGW